jgi:hypothetical protein
MRMLTGLVTVLLTLLTHLLLTPLPALAVTFMDSPLLPDMTFAPALATRVRAPVLDDGPRQDLQVQAVPLFKTLRYPLRTDQQVRGRILPTGGRSFDPRFDGRY